MTRAGSARDDPSVRVNPSVRDNRSVLLHPQDRHALAGAQLDLFADLDAAAARLAEQQQRLRAEQAPSLYDSPARGVHAREEALSKWTALYGVFGSRSSRSHAWHTAITSPVAEAPTARCLPTLMTADLRCDHHGQPCCCLGGLYYRGACLGCPWEGPVRDHENPAVEDAHDHSWPGWRDLPTVPRRPDTGSGTSSAARTRLTGWAAQVHAAYPAGWLTGGGPIRTQRQAARTRHVPAHSGFGGYDLAVLAPQPQATQQQHAARPPRGHQRPRARTGTTSGQP